MSVISVITFDNKVIFKHFSLFIKGSMWCLNLILFPLSALLFQKPAHLCFCLRSRSDFSCLLSFLIGKDGCNCSQIFTESQCSIVRSSGVSCSGGLLWPVVDPRPLLTLVPWLLAPRMLPGPPMWLSYQRCLRLRLSLLRLRRRGYWYSETYFHSQKEPFLSSICVILESLLIRWPNSVTRSLFQQRRRRSIARIWFQWEWWNGKRAELSWHKPRGMWRRHPRLWMWKWVQGWFSSRGRANQRVWG